MRKTRQRDVGAETPDADRAGERLQSLLAEACPGREPSLALRQRIAEMAERHEAVQARRSAIRRRLRVVLAFATVTALAALLVLNMPALVAANALRRMEAAISDVRSAHMVTWSLMPDGTLRKCRETWYQAGRWRMERPGHIDVYSSGRHWSYEPEAGIVRVRRLGEGQFGDKPPDFSVVAMARNYGHARIRLDGTTTWNGRRARRVLIEPRVERSRDLVLADAATDLPLRMEIQRETGVGWVAEMSEDYCFNLPLPARLFAPDFPKTTRRVDVEAEQGQWGARLARGLARRFVGDRTLVLRDLQVNAAGDLFMLYSAGKFLGDTTRDWSVDVADDLGTRYLPSGYLLQPCAQPHPPQLPNGYVFNGEKLEGDCWVPLEAPRARKPRRFTVTFHVALTNSHGQEYRARPAHPVGVVFTMHLERPEAALVPAYMPYMAFGPNEIEVRLGEAEARAHYYRYFANDPERALALYREELEIVREESLAIAEPVLQPQTWLDVSELLRDLGRPAEARTALLRARDEDLYGNLRQKIENALAGGG